MDKNNSTNQSLQLATSFVPGMLRRQYSSEEPLTADGLQTEAYSILLWIDLTNFSPLCNRLIKDSVDGVEKITTILNSYYSHVLTEVDDFGGEPIFFAGDGIMSAWTSDNASLSREQLMRKVCACAHKIISTITTLDDRNELLSVHAIISDGSLHMAELEGVYGSKHVVFTGEGFHDLVRASKNNYPNELLISNKALSLLDATLKRKAVEHDTSILSEYPEIVLEAKPEEIPVSEYAALKLKSFIPHNLQLSLTKEKLNWIAELRPVTIVFVKLSNYSDDAVTNLNQLRDSIALITPLVLRHGGLLNQIWVDEKDSNALICFGPPPSSHINNPERSVRLALEIHHVLNNAGFDNSAGISNGMAFCGVLGNNLLRQYTVISDVVNTGARLAGLKKNSVLCDESIYKATSEIIHYDEPEMHTLKGSPQPIPIYAPKNVIDDNSKESRINMSIGRKNELKILTDALEAAAKGEGSCFVVEGENGMGKTMLLEDFMEEKIADSLVLNTSGDFITKNTPYSTCESIFLQVLRLNETISFADGKSDFQKVIDMYGSRACLLNIVLRTNFEESDEVKNYTGTQKVAAIHDLLIEILNNVSVKTTLAIIIDDAQWMDEASWKLMNSINDKVKRCLIILSLPSYKFIHNVSNELLRKKKIIKLEPLSDDELELLLCKRLGVASIADEVKEIVFKMGKGNPFFSIELTRYLKDQKLLLIENDHCSLSDKEMISEILLPESIRSAIFGRIDKLTKGSQLSLKVGSVIGRRFAKIAVNNIYPIKTEKAQVPAYLREAKDFGFIDEQAVDHLDGYFFRNDTIAKIAYDMTLSEQKKLLHKECAEWFEATFKDSLYSFYVFLAHHWLEAGFPNKAAVYYEKEAIRLFRLGFAQQALDFGLEGVKLLYGEIERDPQKIGPQIGEHFMFISGFMASRSIEHLIEHDKLDDENTANVISMLLELCPIAHQCQQAELFALMAIITVRLTLEQGNGPSAAEVYAMYSIIYKSITNDSTTALAWSTLSMEIDKQNDNTLQSRVSFIHGWFIAHWLAPLPDLIAIAETGADAGFRSGDILFGCFSLSLVVILKSSAGYTLDEVISTAEEHSLINNNLVINAAFHLKHEQQVAKALQGRTNDYTSLSDSRYDEEKDIASICSTDLYNQIGYYLISKLKLNAHFGNWNEAVGWGDKAWPLLPAIASQPGHFELEFFYAYASLYCASEAADEAKQAYIEKANAGMERIQNWSTLCPANFGHNTLLLSAISKGLIDGNMAEAEELIQKSVEMAMASGYIQYAALAYESLARMQKTNGLPFTDAFENAINTYTDWGAEGKTKYLREFFYA